MLNTISFSNIVVQLIILVGVLLVSLTVHEFMHGLVAYKLGDTTAHDHGRLSFNPWDHIDPFMTILLPVISIALVGVPLLAAKPVPVNTMRLKYNEFGGALVALAGPLSNLAIAGFSALALHSLQSFSGVLAVVLQTTLVLNIGLFVFNIIPFPPLDGSRVLYAFAPEPVQDFMNRIEPFGFFIVFALVLSGALDGVLQMLNTSVYNFLM